MVVVMLLFTVEVALGNIEAKLVGTRGSSVLENVAVALGAIALVMVTLLMTSPVVDALNVGNGP